MSLTAPILISGGVSTFLASVLKPDHVLPVFFSIWAIACLLGIFTLGPWMIILGLYALPIVFASFIGVVFGGIIRSLFDRNRQSAKPQKPDPQKPDPQKPDPQKTDPHK